MQNGLKHAFFKKLSRVLTCKYRSGTALLLTMTSKVNGKTGILTPCTSENPENFITKIEKFDYVLQCRNSSRLGPRVVEFTCDQSPSRLHSPSCSSRLSGCGFWNALEIVWLTHSLAATADSLPQAVPGLALKSVAQTKVLESLQHRALSSSMKTATRRCH